MRCLRAVALLVSLVVGGCAGDPGWVNPALPKDRWSYDLGACRREAEDDLGPDVAMTPGDERSSDPMKLVEQSRNAKRFDALVGTCMREKGYRPAK